MTNQSMPITPQDLVASLLLSTEEEGRKLLHTYIPMFDDETITVLVELIKSEADRQWIRDSQISFMLAGHLLLVGEMTRNKSHHALGLMARGDALRAMNRDEDALPFFDAAGDEYQQIGDEVGWARTRIGRVSASIQLSRTTEALRDAAQARDIFVRHGKLLRVAQMDVNVAIIN